MAIDMQPLLGQAFFHVPLTNATQAIAEARDRYAAETQTAGFSFELVVPDDPDQPWLADKLIRPLVYFCQSYGVLPSCAGVFVSLFVRSELYCVAASKVIHWASVLTGMSTDDLVAAYGTRESETTLH